MAQGSKARHPLAGLKLREERAALSLHLRERAGERETRSERLPSIPAREPDHSDTVVEIKDF